MIKSAQLATLLCLAFALTASVAPGGENFATNLPRVFLLDSSYISQARERVLAGDKTLVPAVAALKRDADAALESGPYSVMSKDRIPPSGDKHDFMSQAPYYWPNTNSPSGEPYIRRDGERDPDIYKLSDRRNLGRMIGSVKTLATAYYFTTNEAYAAKAAALLRTWFLDPTTRMNPNFEFAQAVPGADSGRGTGLIETAGLTSLVDAVGLLEGSKRWNTADQQVLQEWFSRFLQWMKESRNGRSEGAAKNNHGSFYDLQVVCFSLFVGKTNEARHVLEEVKEKRIARQIEPDGRQPLELQRTRSWSYSVFNLRALFSLATVAEAQGVDLWNFETRDGRSIDKALDYLIPFALKEKKWPYRQPGEFSGRDLFPLIRQAALKYQGAIMRGIGPGFGPLIPPAGLCCCSVRPDPHLSSLKRFIPRADTSLNQPRLENETSRVMLQTWQA